MTGQHAFELFHRADDVVGGPRWLQGWLCGFRRPAVDLRDATRRSSVYMNVDELEVLATLSYSRLGAQEDGPWPRTPESLAPLIATRPPEGRRTPCIGAVGSGA